MGRTPSRWASSFRIAASFCWPITTQQARSASQTCSSDLDQQRSLRCEPEDKSGDEAFFTLRLRTTDRGLCTSAATAASARTPGHYRDNTYGAFFSDVWQLGHGLTVNAGLRWEYNSPSLSRMVLKGTLDPTVEQDYVPARFQPSFLRHSRFTLLQIPPINPVFSSLEGKDSVPRLGVAYEAFSRHWYSASVAVYFFDNINTNELQFTRYAAPLYYQQSLSNIFVQNAFPDPTLGSAGLPAPFSINPNNSMPYTYEWTASVQQDLGHGMILEIAYTASATRKLWKRYDQNMDLLFPGYTRVRRQQSDQCGSPSVSGRFNTASLPSRNAATANFNGGSVKVEKRAKNGLYFLGSLSVVEESGQQLSGEVEANDTSYSNDFRLRLLLELVLTSGIARS